jgi:hypothetical protein
MTNPDKVPLIVAGDRDTFGSAREGTEYYASGQDVTYVPGYSNVRRENAARQLRREKPLPLKARLHWARWQTPTGKPDARDISSRQAQGYQFVTKDNLATLGIEAPPSAQLDPATGHYVCGDVVLMYCPRDLAARNENVLRRATEERSSADATASDLHAEGGKLGRSVGEGNLTESSVKQELRNSPT